MTGFLVRGAQMLPAAFDLHSAVQSAIGAIAVYVCVREFLDPYGSPLRRARGLPRGPATKCADALLRCAALWLLAQLLHEPRTSRSSAFLVWLQGALGDKRALFFTATTVSSMGLSCWFFHLLPLALRAVGLLDDARKVQPGKSAPLGLVTLCALYVCGLHFVATPFDCFHRSVHDVPEARRVGTTSAVHGVGHYTDTTKLGATSAVLLSAFGVLPSGGAQSGGGAQGGAQGGVLEHLAGLGVVRWSCTTQASCNLPQHHDFLLHLALLLLFDDCLFYVLHRGAHASRALYHWYHAVHHKCRVPSGMFAMLAHPAEFAPGMVALKVFNPHPYTAFVWMVLRVWEGVDTHCGYDSPCSVFNLFRGVQGGAIRHDLHHSAPHRGNYGSFFCLWDVLLGTHAEQGDGEGGGARAVSPARRWGAGLLLGTMWGCVGLGYDLRFGSGTFMRKGGYYVALNGATMLFWQLLVMAVDPKGQRMSAFMAKLDPCPTAAVAAACDGNPEPAPKTKTA